MSKTKLFTVITLFPELVRAYMQVGVVGRACAKNKISINIIDLRDFSTRKSGRVDDSSYGGGPGMVIAVEPVRRAISNARGGSTAQAHVMYMSPQGERFNQLHVPRLANFEHIVLLAGRYEGIDERVLQKDIDTEWSVGDYVLSGGELPALTIIDAIARTIPGVLGSDLSAVNDSFMDGLLDFPHYTRPVEIDGEAVPNVLLGGNHKEIERWRRKQALGRTYVRRPDLLRDKKLSEEDKSLLQEFVEENQLI